METASTIGGFNPPLKIGDRFRSTLGNPRWGYSVVERVGPNFVVGAHHMPDGTRGGHVNIWVFNEAGTNNGGYTRLG